MKWKPDTCNCIIYFDNKIKFISYDKKCEIHNSLEGQELLDEIMKHNRANNNKEKKNRKRKDNVT